MAMWPWLYCLMTRIAAGKFKDRCLKILDTVAETRRPVVVTKRGRPVATIVPYSGPRKAARTLVGSIVKETGDPFATDERWDADRP
jgi:prevent-host-death family protein